MSCEPLRDGLREGALQLACTGHLARSRRVRAGAVTGMPRWVRTSSGPSVRRAVDDVGPGACRLDLGHGDRRSSSLSGLGQPPEPGCRAVTQLGASGRTASTAAHLARQRDERGMPHGVDATVKRMQLVALQAAFRSHLPRSPRRATGVSRQRRIAWSRGWRSSNLGLGAAGARPPHRQPDPPRPLRAPGRVGSPCHSKDGPPQVCDQGEGRLSQPMPGQRAQVPAA